MKQKNKDPQVYDVILAVEELDKHKKNTSEYEKAHKIAKSEVERYNSFHGHGKYSMSISLARHLIQEKYVREKAKIRIGENRAYK